MLFWAFWLIVLKCYCVIVCLPVKRLDSQIVTSVFEWWEVPSIWTEHESEIMSAWNHFQANITSDQFVLDERFKPKCSSANEKAQIVYWFNQEYVFVWIIAQFYFQIRDSNLVDSASSIRLSCLLYTSPSPRD